MVTVLGVFITALVIFVPFWLFVLFPMVWLSRKGRITLWAIMVGIAGFALYLATLLLMSSLDLVIWF